MAEKESTKDSLLRKAYTIATTQLRDAHKEEFLKYQQAAAQKLGVDWTPRKTKEQRAREQVSKLLEANPALRDELLAHAREQVAAEATADGR